MASRTLSRITALSFCIAAACSGGADAPSDAGGYDAATIDAATVDAAAADAAHADAAGADAAHTDAAPPDAAPSDAAPPDADPGAAFFKPCAVRHTSSSDGTLYTITHRYYDERGNHVRSERDNDLDGASDETFTWAYNDTDSLTSYTWPRLLWHRPCDLQPRRRCDDRSTRASGLRRRIARLRLRG